MIFQRILKGIVGVTPIEARARLAGGGIPCNWWRDVNPLPSEEIPGRLTPENLFRHLSAYDQIDPATGLIFGRRTPFISTTAGTVERDPHFAQNTLFSALITALSFATAGFRKSGAIFHGYVNVLGRPAVGLQEFAEETRDLHQWTDFQPYHPEGEIVAKIQIPAAHLECAEGYDGQQALAAFRSRRLPQPLWRESNTRYFVPPEDVSNIRDALL